MQVICIDKWLSHISNRGQLNTYILFYYEIANCGRKQYVRSSFMVHGDAETALENLKGILIKTSIESN